MLGRPAGSEMLLQHRPVRGEDGDARARPAQLPAAGGDDVAIRVPAHAVDAARLAEVVQDGERAERAIVQDRVGAQLAHRVQVVVALGDVERALVPGEEQPVRAGGVEGQAFDGTWSLAALGRSEAVDRVVVELAVAVVVAIAGVGEPDAAGASRARGRWGC